MSYDREQLLKDLVELKKVTREVDLRVRNVTLQLINTYSDDVDDADTLELDRDLDEIVDRIQDIQRLVEPINKFIGGSDGA